MGFEAKLRNFFFKVNPKHQTQVRKFEIGNQENAFMEKNRNFVERKKNQRFSSKEKEEEDDEMRDTGLRNEKLVSI